MWLKKIKWNKDLLLMSLIVATESIGVGIIFPALAQITSAFDASGVIIGLVIAGYSIAQLFGAPILGILSDKYGRRPCLIISQIGTVLSLIMMAFAQNWVHFFIARLIDGFSGGNVSVARAYISDVTEDSERANGMSFLGVATGVGLLLGPIIGSILYTRGHGGHFWAGIAAATCSLFALILTYKFLKEPKVHHNMPLAVYSPKRTISIIFKQKYIALFFLHFLFMFYMFGLVTSFPIFTQEAFDLSASQNSSLFVYMGIIIMLVQFLIINKVKSRYALVSLLGFFLVVVGCATLPQYETIPGLIITLGITAFGIGLITPTIATILSLTKGTDLEGELMGVLESVGGLGAIAGPLSFGLLFDTVGIRSAFHLLALFLFILMMISYRQIMTKYAPENLFNRVVQ